MKIIGVLFVLCGCGGFGFYLAYCCRMEENCLRQVLRAIEYMICELDYRQTDLPALCTGAGTLLTGPVRNFFLCLGDELDAQVSADAAECVMTSLHKTILPKSVCEVLHQMGQTMGQFDLQGQISGLESIKADLSERLRILLSNRDVRIRNYQTLGLCAGAAIVILFI